MTLKAVSKRSEEVEGMGRKECLHAAMGVVALTKGRSLSISMSLLQLISKAVTHPKTVASFLLKLQSAFSNAAR